MEKLFNNITKIVVYLIMTLGVVFTAWTISKGGGLKDDAILADQVLNPYFILSIVTIIIAAAAAILFPLGQMASNPKTAVRAGISIVILAAVYLISWSLASDSVVEPVYQKFNITPTGARFIGSLIYVVYILGALSILSVIGSAVIGLISKR